MAASKDKAQALKNSYVDGIIDELGGASDPAARMAMRENDIASYHVFPTEGKRGAINDNDPSMYVHSDDKSYKVRSGSEYANPVQGSPNGSGYKQILENNPAVQKQSEELLEYMQQDEQRRMGGSGDVARLGPRSLEEFNRRNPSNRPPEKRTIQRRDRSSAGGFDSSNLAGAMGMEQGQSATHIMDLDAGHHQYVNDGRPVMMIKRNSEVRGMRDVGSALPIKGEGMGAERFVPISAQGRNAGNRAFNSGRMDHVGYYN